MPIPETRGNRACGFHEPISPEREPGMAYWACDLDPKDDPVIRRVNISWSMGDSTIEAMYIIYRKARLVSVVDYEIALGRKADFVDRYARSTRWVWDKEVEVYASALPPFEVLYAIIRERGAAKWIHLAPGSALMPTWMSPGT